MTSKATVFDFGITVPVFCYLNHWYNSTGSVLAHASYSSQTTLAISRTLRELAR